MQSVNSKGYTVEHMETFNVVKKKLKGHFRLN